MAISLSAFPARFNDYLERAHYQECGETKTAKLLDRTIGPTCRKISQNILARVVATTVFPIFASIDLTLNLSKALIHRSICLIAKDSNRHALIAKACMQEADKCFFGLISSPFSLINPDLVTRHFVPKITKNGVIEAGGKYHSAKGSEHTPETIDQLQALIKKAIAEKMKVTLSGAHYSQSKDTLPSDSNSLCINMKKLNKVRIDTEKKTVRAQAGATWADIQEAANRHGLAVKVMQASNVFSVGGSLSVNCHGWDHQTGTVGETVRSLTVIDQSGNIQKLTPNDELFRLCIGGHGLFAAIIEAEIELCDNEALVSCGEKIDPKDYVAYFQSQILPDPNTVMHLYRLSLDPKNLLKEGIAVSYCKKTKKHPMQGLGVGNLIDEPEKGTRMDRIMVHLARTTPFTRSLYWKMESARIQNEEKCLRNHIMRPPINAAFNNSRADADWLQEYFVPGNELAPFLENLGKTLTKNDVTLLNASVRFVKKDTLSKLPYAKNQDMYAIVLFFNQSLAPEEIEKTKRWVQETIDDAHKKGGTYYLPYQHFATKEQFNTSYPDAKGLSHDANSLFTNGLAQDYLH